MKTTQKTSNKTTNTCPEWHPGILFGYGWRPRVDFLGPECRNISIPISFGTPCRHQNPSKIEEILKKTASGSLRRRTRKAARRETRKTSVSEGAHPHETLRIHTKNQRFSTFAENRVFASLFTRFWIPFDLQNDGEGFKSPRKRPPRALQK